MSSFFHSCLFRGAPGLAALASIGWLGLSACAAAEPTGRLPAVQLTEIGAHAGASVLPVLRPGDVIRLVAEPDHPFDLGAVAAYWGPFKMGYLPADQAWRVRCPPACTSSDEPALARVVGVEDGSVTVDVIVPSWAVAQHQP